jgi:hypothetical protein
LVQERVLASCVLPVSVGLTLNIQAYSEALISYRCGNPVPIVEVLTEALEVALYVARIAKRSISSLLEEWHGLVGDRKGSKICQAPFVLLDQPVLNSAFLARSLDVTQRSATSLILRLCECGIISKMGKRKRGDFYQSKVVLQILDEITEASTFHTIQVEKKLNPRMQLSRVRGEDAL